jgi:glutaminase
MRMKADHRISFPTALVAALAVTVAAPTLAKDPAPNPTMKDFQRVVDAAHARFKDLKDGKNADYIPILTETPSDLFGVVIVTRDGKVFSAGDVDYKFSIQSCQTVYRRAVIGNRTPVLRESRRRADWPTVQLQMALEPARRAQ